MGRFGVVLVLFCFVSLVGRRGGERNEGMVCGYINQ